MPHSVSADRRPRDRKSTRLNSSHTVIYTLSLHDALPICFSPNLARFGAWSGCAVGDDEVASHAALGECRPEATRSEEHTSELQSHRDLHSFPTRRSSDLLQPKSSAVRRMVGLRGRR